MVSGPNYHHGVRALANSLRRVSSIPLLALCTHDADQAALTASGIHVIEVPEIVNPNRIRRIQARFAATYTKLNVFRLDFLDRLVYLDGDTVVLQNIDELFAGDDFAAAPDAGLDRANGKIFNSGVFAVTPSHELFHSLLDRLGNTASYDGGDQGFLNNIFTDWRRLPQEYNTTKRMFAHHPALFNAEEIKVLHYVGVKPWEPVKPGSQLRRAGPALAGVPRRLGAARADPLAATTRPARWGRWRSPRPRRCSARSPSGFAKAALTALQGRA